MYEKGIFNSNKLKMKNSIAGFEHASFSGPVQYRNSVTLYPLGTWKRIDVEYTWTR